MTANYAERKADIEEASPHPVGQIAIGTPKKSDQNANPGKSGRNAEQINDSQKSICHEECTDQAASNCPSAIEEEF